MHKPIVRFVLVFLVLSAAVSAGELAVYSGYTVYPNPQFQEQSLVEFPFSINRQQLSFFQPDSSDDIYYARVFAQLDMFSTEGVIVDSARTYFSVTAASPEEAQSVEQRVFNSLGLKVAPGVYSARITVIDAVSKDKGEFFFNAVNVVPPANVLSTGGFMTLYSLHFSGDLPPEEQSVFFKNGYTILPNPLSIYTTEDTSLSVYGEIYNLEFDNSNTGRYQVIAEALDETDQPYMNFGSRVTKKPGGSAVFTGSFDIANWPKGAYTFRLITIDLDNQAADTTLLPFKILSLADIQLAIVEQNRLKKLSETALMNDPYDSLNLDQKQHLVKYLLTEEQERTLNMLNDSAKVVFLQQYWSEHDEFPATVFNESRLEMIKRYQYANQKFSTNDRKDNGWLSDRGRIYMSFGGWDDRDDYEAPRIGNPFEVWYYDRYEEGYVFVFDDWSGNDDYRLVHSNVDGERYDKDWADRLQTGFLEILE